MKTENKRIYAVRAKATIETEQYFETKKEAERAADDARKMFLDIAIHVKKHGHFKQRGETLPFPWSLDPRIDDQRIVCVSQHDLRMEEN